MPAHQATPRRYGGRTASKTILMGSLIGLDGADTADPSAAAIPTEIQGVPPSDQYSEIRWMIRPPTWATSYSVRFWRHVAAARPNADTVAWSGWVMDEEVAVSTGEPLVYFQFLLNETTMFQIVDIVGTPDTTTGFVVVYTFVEKGA
jgi:hypothetical protein